MPAISVILPIYNMENYIEETLDSIVGQSFKDFELLCVDDGSTDSSLSIIQSYCQTDSRIKIISQNNSGPGAARNAGLDQARGDYVCMLDADDIYEEQMFRKMYDKAVTTNADIVVTRSTQFEDETGKKLESWWTLNISQIPLKEVFNARDMRDFIFSAFIGWPWDKLYKRSFIERFKIRYPSLPNSEDLYFVFLSLAKAQRISIIDETLINHRVGRTNSVSNSRSKEPLAFYRSTCLLKDELKKDPALYSDLSWGFLNWAFGYMLWNIETMTDQTGRAIQLDALLNDGFPELEISSHSPAYFSLEPGSYDRYLALLHEATGQSNTNIVRSRKRVILPRCIQFLSLINEKGLAQAIRRTLGWVTRRIGRQKIQQRVGQVNQQRAEDFAVSGSLFQEKNQRN